jgi:hypothetical protein
MTAAEVFSHRMAKSYPLFGCMKARHDALLFVNPAKKGARFVKSRLRKRSEK